MYENNVNVGVYKKTLYKNFSASYIKNVTNIWERSSVWLERMPVTHEVASSSLVVPAIIKSPHCGLFL